MYNWLRWLQMFNPKDLMLFQFQYASFHFNSTTWHINLYAACLDFYAFLHVLPYLLLLISTYLGMVLSVLLWQQFQYISPHWPAEPWPGCLFSSTPYWGQTSRAATRVKLFLSQDSKKIKEKTTDHSRKQNLDQTIIAWNVLSGMSTGNGLSFYLNIKSKESTIFIKTKLKFHDQCLN